MLQNGCFVFPQCLSMSDGSCCVFVLDGTANVVAFAFMLTPTAEGSLTARAKMLEKPSTSTDLASVAHNLAKEVYSILHYQVWLKCL